MKLKRKVIALLLIGVLLLTACTGGNGNVSTPAGNDADTESAGEQDEATTPATPGEVTVIRVWSDNAHERELRMEQIERFNTGRGLELGIEIDYQVYGANWIDAITIAAQTGEAPDLFRPNGSILPDFVEAGYFVPLSSLPNMEDFIAKYEGSLIVNQHIFNGEVYTLPYNLTTYKLVINRDLFDKNGIENAPTTWAEMREIARIITENGNGEEFGWALGLQSAWIAGAYFFRAAAKSVGHIGFDNNTLEFVYSDFIPFFDEMVGMVQDGSVLPGASGMDADAMRAQFAEGRVGMLTAASFDVGVYNDQFPANFNWEAVDLPTIDGVVRYRQFADATSLLGVGEAALASPERAAKAAEVFKFFYSDENAAEMYERSLYIPFRQEAIDMATREPSARGFAEFADVGNFILMLPMPDGLVTIEGLAWRDVVLNILSASPDGTPTELLNDLDARMNAALAEQISEERLESFRAPAGYDPRQTE